MVLLFIGSTELLLIGGIALLLFGGKKLPEMMKGLGQGVREFKKGMREVKEEAYETSTTDSSSKDFQDVVQDGKSEEIGSDRVVNE